MAGHIVHSVLEEGRSVINLLHKSPVAGRVLFASLIQVQNSSLKEAEISVWRSIYLGMKCQDIGKRTLISPA